MKKHDIVVFGTVILVFIAYVSQADNQIKNENVGGTFQPTYSSVTESLKNDQTCSQTEKDLCVDTSTSLFFSTSCGSWRSCVQECLIEIPEEKCINECNRLYIDSAPTFEDSKLCACEVCTNICTHLCNCNL